MPRVERKARNMALYRDVNERVAELAWSLDPPGQTQVFICECGHETCSLFVLLPLAAYAQIPRDGTTFLVIPGHEDREHEQVLVGTSQYLLVRPRSDTRAEDVCATTRSHAADSPGPSAE